ncbi:MAG: ABC transporter ATP-binding protein [Lachnospiraceae bacterium]|nr:ABC transporter ATP-binding protein [Lachnospiraceae bacterium]
MSLVKVSGLRKSYHHSIAERLAGERECSVLKGIDFQIEKEDFTGIMGRSGCGKTTLLKIIGTIEQPTKGTICYGSADVRRLHAEELAALRRNQIGFVFQDFQLMNNLSVEENIMLPLVLSQVRYRDMRAVVDRNARLLELSGLLKKYPYELSGGEKQRVAIARALSNNPDIILADEPTGNLDMPSAQNIMDCFTRIHRNHHKAVVMVTHDPLVASYCRRIIFLADGVIRDVCERNDEQSQEDFYGQIIELFRNFSVS